MGTYLWYKPENVRAVDALMAEMGGDEFKARVVAHRTTAEAVFFVVKGYQPASTVYVPDEDGNVRSLLICKLDIRPRERFNFGYKPMDEGMGPYGCEAPMSLFEFVSPLRPLTKERRESLYDPVKSAHEYRERCRKVAELKAVKAKLRAGQRVKLAKPANYGNGNELDEFTVVELPRNRRKPKLAFRAVKNGMLCSIPARLLVDAEIS